MSATMSTSPHDAQRARYQRPWCRKHRQRKPNIRAMIKDAEKDGKKVSGATVTADGSVTLQFGEARTEPKSETDRELEEFNARHG
jgi:hypothetical protein